MLRSFELSVLQATDPDRSAGKLSFAITAVLLLSTWETRHKEG